MLYVPLNALALLIQRIVFREQFKPAETINLAAERNRLMVLFGKNGAEGSNLILAVTVNLCLFFK